MSESSFRTSLRSATRGLWEEAISKAQFKSAMTKALQKELTLAWSEGSSECDVSSDELTDEETEALTDFIKNQFTFIDGFADAIKEADNSDSKTIFPLFERAKLWQDRYPEAKANGHAMACKDEKQEFVLGPTESHCRTCKGLNGKVYRNSIWVKNNAVPPHNWNFACKGGCECSLQKTSKRLTRGRFPVGLLG